ncbi:MAG: hypothetical protein ACKVP7_03450 [Hyphomicrobiaceae bacterium]
MSFTSHTVPASPPRAIYARAEARLRSLFEPLGHYVWHGASGRHFTHAVYSLIGCPAPLAASYVLVRHDADGRRALESGRTIGTVASLNLAEIRRRGATLGANEVHLHALGDTDRERAAAAFDIATAHDLLGAPASDLTACN